MSLKTRDRQIASTTTVSQGSASSKFQEISITELISEGPIEGLVEGPGSVFLNGTRVGDPDIAPLALRRNVGDGVTVTAGSTSVDITTSYYNSYNGSIIPFSDTRNITILSAATSNALSITKDYDDTNALLFNIVLTTSSAFFESWMENPAGDSSSRISLKIADTGETIHGRIIITSSTEAIFYPSDGNNTTAGLFVDRINSSDVSIDAHFKSSVSQGVIAGVGFNATLADASPVSGEFDANFSSAYGTSDSLYNLENTTVQFRNGELHQPAVAAFGGNSVGSTFITSPGFQPAALEHIGAGSESEGPAAPVPEIRGSDPTGFGLTAAQAREVDEIRFTTVYPNMRSYKSSGHEAGHHAFYNIDITFERGSDSSTVRLVTDRKHYGDENTPTIFEEVINLEPFKPFDDFVLKVERTTNHDGKTTNAAKQTSGNEHKGNFAASITSVSSVIKENLTHPYTAYANISFDSKQFSSMPKRTYHCRGLKISVPSNYTTREENDGIEALYSGLWDGSFRLDKVYTNNPAWIFYDILTNNRYGLGDWLSSIDIDKYALYRIGKYCDELVSDGRGGLEPRFTSNIYLTKATDAYKVLKDIASGFLSMLYWMDGQVTLVSDQQKDPVYTFSKANVINGVFSYENSGSKTRINQVLVTWNNPQNNYDQEALIVEDQINIASSGKIITEEAVAFGCTSEAQALRFGRWKLWTAINQTELVSFETSVNAAFLVPGDIIYVQDADRTSIQLAGRVSNSGTLNVTTVPLDRAITLNAGSTYEISLIIQGDLTENGQDDAPTYTEVETRTVSNAAGVTNSLSVTSAFSYAPTPDSIFVIKETNASGATTESSAKKYKILAITQNDKFNYAITAIEYYDEKFSSIDEDFNLTLEDTVFPPVRATDVVPPVANIYVSRYPNPTTRGDEFSVHWDKPLVDGLIYQNLNGFEIYHTVPGYDSPIIVSKEVTSLDFQSVPDDFYSVSIRTINTLGSVSRPNHLLFEINDPFTLTIPRVQEGLGIGGKSSAGIVSDGSYVVNFETSPVYFAPAANPSNVTTPTVTGLNTIASEIADGTYKIFYDSSEEELLAVDYYTDDASDENYWYNVIDADGTPEDTFVSKTGTVAIDAGSNLVTGTGTSFTTEYVFNQIIKFNSTKAAKIVAIISDTQLYIDKSFDTAITASAHSTPGLSIEFEEDTLIGEFTKSGSTSTFNSYMSIDRTLRGLDGLSILLSNDSHTLPVTNEQVVDYTGSGLTVRVLEGSTSLQYDSTATQASELAAGEYFITISDTDITAGGISVSGTDAVIADHSSMVANNAVVSITVTGKNFAGVEFSFVKNQTLAKALSGTDGTDGIDAIAIFYSNQSHTVPVTNAGAETWTGSGGTLSVFDGTTELVLDTNSQSAAYPTTNGRYRLDITKVSGDTLQEPTITGGGTAGATLGDFSGDLTQATQYQLSVYAKTLSGTEYTYNFKISLSPSFEGADGLPGDPGKDAITIFYSNQSHTVPVTNAGTETWTGSGGVLNLSEGETDLILDSDSQTATYPTTNGRYRLNITKVSGDTLTEPTITGAGSAGATLGDFAGDLTQATQYNLSIYVKSLNGTEYNYNFKISLSPSFEGADGVDAITVFYSNPSHTVLVTNAGAETWTGSGGNLLIYDGTTELVLDTNTQGTAYPTTNGRYRLNITKVGGDTLTEPTITGAGNAEAVLGDFAGDLTQATQYQLSVYAKTLSGTQYNYNFKISLSPSFQGADGIAGPRTVQGFLYYQTSADPAPSAPSASSYDFDTGEFGTITSGWALTAPTFQAGNSNKYWYAPFTTTEDTFEGTNTTTVGTVRQGIGFSGLVTFDNGQLTDGPNTTAFTDFDADDVQSAIENNVTTIDGGKISTNSLSAISANLGSITAGTLRNNGGNYIPDADAAPSGSEQGAFIDLDDGKFVFGNANEYILFDGSNLTIKGTLNANDIQGDVITIIPFGVDGISVSGTTETTVGEILMPEADHPDGHTPNAIVTGEFSLSGTTGDATARLYMKTSQGISTNLGVPDEVDNYDEKPGIALRYLYYNGDITDSVSFGETATQGSNSATISSVSYSVTNGRTSITLSSTSTWNTTQDVTVGIASNTYYEVAEVRSGETGNNNEGRPFALQGSLGKSLAGDITLKLTIQGNTSETLTIRNTNGTLMGLR